MCKIFLILGSNHFIYQIIIDAKVIDLGCGTGLVGAELKDTLISLIGVDFSEQMLVKARQKQSYHKLIKMDLRDYLTSQSPHSVHVIVAADVFIYLGKLNDIFSSAKQVD